MVDKVLLHRDPQREKLKFYASNANRLGLLHVVTGDGKGKSTSSIGLCVRARGNGFKVLFIQFFKMNTGELDPLRKIGVDVEQFQFLGPFFKKYNEEEFKEMQKEFKEFWGTIEKKIKNYDLVVLDEIVYIITKNIWPEKNFLEFLDRRPKNTELVLTGRDFPDSIKKRADYLSEVKKARHPFEKGVAARKGVEF